jgi:hypothetical protein
MSKDQPDRLVRLLNALVSAAYYLLWIAVTVLFIAAPVARLWTRGQPGWFWHLSLPVIARGSASPVDTSWGPARFVVDQARGNLVLSLDGLPWWLPTMLWAQALVGLCLLLLIVHHLRRIIQRVRDGMPFDVQNAIWMRRIGLLFLTLTLFNGLVRLMNSMVVREGVTGDTIGVTGELRLDFGNLIVALVVIALAEVFRRGSELEHEQSLVI